MKYKSTHTGFCRVYYYAQNKDNEKLLYCLQEETKGQFELLRCSMDGEPSHTAKARIPLPFSPGSSTLDLSVNKWLKEIQHKEVTINKINDSKS